MELTKTKFKQTEIGFIPEDWDIKNVGDCFEICNNLRLPISQEIRKSMQGIYPYYGPTKIQDYINEYRVDGEYALIGEDGDHFLKWYTHSMTQLATGKFNVNNHAHLIKGNDKDTTTAWFYYFFKNRDITQFLTRQGAGRYKLSKAGLINLPCAYPEIEEQKAIAQVLSDTDNLIQSIEQKLSKKRAIKQGAMQQLLTPKEDWEVKKLGEVSTMSSGGTPSSKIAEYYDGNILWVSISDITKAGKFINDSAKKITKKGLLNSSAKIFSKNTVLLAMYASIGKCCIATEEVSTSQAILGIEVKKQLLNEYLYYFLLFNGEALASQGQQGTQSNLNKGMVESLDLPLPKFEEQTEIATILSDMDAEIEQLEQKLSKYKMVKQGLMQNLLTGKIRLV